MALRADQNSKPTLRRDYHPPAWLIDQAELTLKLDRDTTRVHARLFVRRNPDSDASRAPLALAGVGLTTRAVRVNGNPVTHGQRRHEGEEMIIGSVPDQAEVETEVEIAPSANTALEGLYAAGNMLLTQCEPEGFRKITWFPDRPDVMTRFRVRLEGSRSEFPVLLSNGNCIEQGELDGGEHYAVWEDPFPKPSYLFAIAAGRLASISDTFITASGRTVALQIHSEPDSLDRLAHAMGSLKRAMRWDEERFGLEYDLDVYHIVATHDFNMGAMENKSLNIFNARYVLADHETATDADFEAVEAVIAHEYFHNWTGNRVTCRDWFQLTLKEGLTVFRDQEFTSDLHSRPVKRIQDVTDLIARQMPEDAGPMAHPVRPERYVEINNFYTATVYEKGAEVVRMYQTLLGHDGFRRGLDLYFQRHDGQAVTCDDFLAAMGDANGRDLGRFERWYRQVGTPTVRAATRFDADQGELVLSLEQSLPEHPDNADLGPLLIPVAVGFLDADNRPLQPVLVGGDTGPSETVLLVLDREREEYRFRGLQADALPSLLRDFSAPVHLEYDWSLEQLARLAGFDPDAVNRWRAGRRLAERILHEGIKRPAGLPDTVALLASAWRATLSDPALDPALAAELLSLPSEAELAEQCEQVDPEAIHRARTDLATYLADHLTAELNAVFQRLDSDRAWSADAAEIARRRLKNIALHWLSAASDRTWSVQAEAQYRRADNMTDRFAALRALVHGNADEADAALADFAERFADDALVMDKWFAVQATRPDPAVAEVLPKLMEHPAFSLRNPNKVRAVVGGFAMANPVAFHRADGAGYRQVADIIAQLDVINPQVAARLAAAFARWQRYEPGRAERMQGELERLAGGRLSPDVGEIVAAALRPAKR
ncbi:aminopeptidase N [Wenzhouxiangella sp. C33]|uniref:Aminopeptidase N n=2 Tax=Wenzhouxiangella limi TaxID=2707351 RepID=A0A845UW02_9GAMM|nr:aminopeptidase N [Wenzhouxiangella limi]NDY96013.1 aminopeptidase N [Wenzhouxiangella limi]